MQTGIENLIEKINANKGRLQLVLYEKASEKEICRFEEFIGTRLPDDLRAFYEFCNGFQSEEDQFRLIPLQEIITNNTHHKRVDFVDFYFAEFLYYCDTWQISISKKNHNDYFIFHQALLSNSFYEFLGEYLTKGYYDGILTWD